jgi:glycosyltransferase involved in cell wall biosynthesis
VARVLLVSNDAVGKQMAGPGIRYRQFALQLAQKHDVSLMIPNETNELLDGVRLLQAKDFGYRRFTRLCRTVDVVVSQQLSVGAMEQLARGDTRTIFDLYDPILFEALGFYGGQQTSEASARQLSQAAILKQILALQTGSAFICASERQRDLWLGVLGALGRIDLERFRSDPSLEKLVGVVPFGLEAAEPQARKRVLKGVVPGIAQDDKVLLWGGGIWNWLDPLTPIRAVAELSRRRPDVKLFFLGVQHPNPRVPAMVMTKRAVELAESLEVRDTHVFFNFGWTPYAERVGYLLEADLGISAHFDSVETRFAFRTRLLDYFWARLPTVATGGDVLGDLVAEKGLGRTVGEGDVEGWVEAIERLLEDGKGVTDFDEVRLRFTWPTVVEPLSEMIDGELPAPHYPAKVLPVLGSYLWSGFFGTLRSRGARGTLGEIAMVLRRPNVP